MKVISFCLFSKKIMERNSLNLYFEGLIDNIKLAPHIYPGWFVRVYYHKEIPNVLLDKLRKYPYVQLIQFHPLAGIKWCGTLERFHPCSDPKVEVMICRDVDSRIGLREKIAVDEWLASDKDFHIIRDHPRHTIEIMACCWGARNKILPDMSKLIYQKASSFTKKYGCDQWFLRDIIYPKIKDNLFSHDEFFNYEDFSKPIQHKRINYEFVAECFDENNIPLYDGRMTLKKALN